MSVDILQKPEVPVRGATITVPGGFPTIEEALTWLGSRVNMNCTVRVDAEPATLTDIEINGSLFFHNLTIASTGGKRKIASSMRIVNQRRRIRLQNVIVESTGTTPLTIDNSMVDLDSATLTTDGALVGTGLYITRSTVTSRLIAVRGPTGNEYVFSTAITATDRSRLTIESGDGEGGIDVAATFAGLNILNQSFFEADNLYTTQETPAGSANTWALYVAQSYAKVENSWLRGENYAAVISHNSAVSLKNCNINLISTVDDPRSNVDAVRVQSFATCRIDDSTINVNEGQYSIRAISKGAFTTINTTLTVGTVADATPSTTNTANAQGGFRSSSS